MKTLEKFVEGYKIGKECRETRHEYKPGSPEAKAKWEEMKPRVMEVGIPGAIGGAIAQLLHPIELYHALKKAKEYQKNNPDCKDDSCDCK